MNGGSDNVALKFSADELNAYFTSSPDTSHISNRPLIQGDSFSFFCVEQMCVAASIGKISSNVTDFDGIPLVFIKLLLPLILPVLTQLFNFILTSSTLTLAWNVSNVVPIPKVYSSTENLTVTLFPSFLSS
jgi:hypothetical protein